MAIFCNSKHHYTGQYIPGIFLYNICSVIHTNGASVWIVAVDYRDVLPVAKHAAIASHPHQETGSVFFRSNMAFGNRTILKGIKKKKKKKKNGA